ncbi:Ig-like domain-containing protein [Colwellia psychrerythraea]|uniref:YD repeat protein n=1 Tax=Colwellia psychrerythraea TaxID=28229 RepID=A0A099KK47_COLPS|nr:Ig-like domain-containing protein [Colwellia psychrerythraea]KGJ91169.1 YD repeat protein [Colwellia psychrerythraea]
MFELSRSFFVWLTILSLVFFSQATLALNQYDKTEAFSVNEDSSKSHSIYGSESTTYQYLGYSSTSHGSLTYNSSTKYITYKPTANYCGSDTYTYSLHKYTSSGGGGGGGGGRPPNLNAVSQPSAAKESASLPAQLTLSDDVSQITVSKTTKGATTLGTIHHITRITVYVTVNCINDAPTISNIASRTISEDSNTGYVPFTIGDVETSTNSLSISVSSNNTALIPTSRINLAGSGANRSIRAIPLANKYGTARITVTVTDGNGATRSDAYLVVVNSVNDIPSTSNISNKAINEDSNTGNIAFTISDVETPASTLSLSATSNNTSLIPISRISFGGSGYYRTVKVTPLANKYGSATITVYIKDSDGGIRSDAFIVTVNSVNDVPTIANITNRSINEDSNTGYIPFSIGDIETPTSSLVLSVTSSKTSLIATSGISFGGSGANRTVKVTPLANQYGSATITVTVRDAHAGIKSDAFVVTVKSVNDAPTITDITAKTIDEDGNTGNLSFTIGDVETATSSLKLSVTSTNPSLIPTSRLVLAGSGANRTIKVTPLTDKHGSATITVTVEDAGGVKKSDAFIVTVKPINDAPIISQGTNHEINLLKGTTKTITLSATDVDNSSLTWSIKSQANKGLASANATTGVISYTSNSNAQADEIDSFVVQVSDGNKTANITIAVTVVANTVQYKYDARGRLISVISSAKEETSFAYDDAGNRTTAGKAN